MAVAPWLGATSVHGEPFTNTLHVTVNAQPPLAKPWSTRYFTRVVQNGESCETTDGVLAMCVSRDYVCRMEVGKEMYAIPPSCLPYDPDTQQDDAYALEEASIAPWGVCDPAVKLKIDDAPICQREFQCLCLHGKDSDCQCVPPDAVADQDGGATCGESSRACGAGEYCQFGKTGGIGCGPKPYYA
ncbi:hypothetical protein BBJ28_00002000 [Nothophytophthora sp. Chile5]|nr:hypothetical protein BBJ28_00002000 [Nothophytophthora sp. Chile5]